MDTLMQSESRSTGGQAPPSPQIQIPPGSSSPDAAASQQGIPPGSERIAEPGYQEQRGNSSGQQPVEGPSFYPADLPDRQLQEERRLTPPVQPQRYNGSYAHQQGQQAHDAVPASSQQQGPASYVPNPQYPPYAPLPQYPPAYVPYGQQPRGAPVPYTDPQAYQRPSNGYAQQTQPPGYPQQGYYVPNGYQPGGYQGYPPGYPPPGYPVYPYVWYPPRPRRNGYQLGMAIASLVGSILAVIAGVLCGIALLGLVLVSTTTSSGISSAEFFATAILYTALMFAGILGGAFGILHSSFALALRPSRPFKLPPFWSFLPVYIGLVVLGLLVGTNDAVINNLPLLFLLIALSGTLPALTFLAFALRRLRRPETGEWPTTWRRFTLALVTGATSAIFLAIVFEGVLTLIAMFEFVGANTWIIDNPNAPVARDPRTIILNLMIVSVVAPIVEEGFKPLAVVTMIGRIRSAAEAFILGMACGMGFDMIETVSYIGMGYPRWIDVAIDRSTAGLLHGFGAGMVALGWYYITHKDALKRYHIQIGLGCMLYAVLQHAIWNGSFVLRFLPSPIGPYLENGTFTILDYQLSAFLIVYVVFSILILCCLWFVTGKIRIQPDAPLGNKNKSDNQANQAPMKVGPVP